LTTVGVENMDAAPLLQKIAKALQIARLEAVMIGNAAAALHGAPVTTLDIDFMFRKTAANLRKLKVLANELEAQILKPYYPLSSLYRIVNDEAGIQLDFMSVLYGITSCEDLRSDAVEVKFGEYAVKVASLEKIIISKKALGRQKDLAVIAILEKTLHEKEAFEERSAQSPEKGA
jgi:predicted nucleotidyltransferase